MEVVESSQKYISLELDPQLVEDPAVLEEALVWPFSKLEGQHLRVESIENISVKPFIGRPKLRVRILLNITNLPEGEMSDNTTLKQELVTRISEAVKSREEANHDLA